MAHADMRAAVGVTPPRIGELRLVILLGCEPGAPVLRIQALVLIVGFIETSSVLGLLSLRRYRPILIASAGGLGLNILLGLLLVPNLGAQGGAIADVITEALLAVGLTAVLTIVVPRHQITAACLPPVVLASALSALMILLPIGSAGHMVAVTVVYFAVLLRLGAIPSEITRASRRFRVTRPSGTDLSVGQRPGGNGTSNYATARQRESEDKHRNDQRPTANRPCCSVSVICPCNPDPAFTGTFPYDHDKPQT